jgi:hypothetical protein
MLVNLAWPRAEFYGTEWYQQYAVVIFVPVITLAGTLYFLLVQRRRVPAAVEPAAELQLLEEVLPDRLLQEVEQDLHR